jgi:hypothetical protein
VTPAQILRAARSRIAVPERWTQGVGARNSRNYCVGNRSASAVSWCALGAILRESESSSEPCRFLKEIVGPSIGGWNDAPGRTHAEVLDAFDRAIALAEAEQ